MRKTLSMWVVVLGLLTASGAQASASFANRNLGLGVSLFKMLGENAGVDWGLPLSLEGGLYLENGFEIFIHPQFMILQVPFGAATPDGRGGIFGFGGHLGTRYLFLEESIRPYLGIHIAVLGLATVPDAKVFVGPGATFGCDFFVGESVSLGARFIFDSFFALNVKPSFSVGGGLYATTYF